MRIVATVLILMFGMALSAAITASIVYGLLLASPIL